MISALINGIADPAPHGPTTQLEQAKQYLIDHKSQIRTFWKGGASLEVAVQVGRDRHRSGYPDTRRRSRRRG